MLEINLCAHQNLVQVWFYTLEPLKSVSPFVDVFCSWATMILV